MATQLGVFGGTFDPIHNGHVSVAAEAAQELSLDKVLFIPAARPPHKEDDVHADPLDRYTMVELAVERYERFAASRIELDREGKSFTEDTLVALRDIYPAAEFFLLLGADAFSEIPTWKNPHRIVQMAQIVVLNRPGFSRAQLGDALAEKVRWLDVTPVDISATEIRRKVREGEPIANMVPVPVGEYIKAHGLYRAPAAGSPPER